MDLRFFAKFICVSVRILLLHVQIHVFFFIYVNSLNVSSMSYNA